MFRIVFSLIFYIITIILSAPLDSRRRGRSFGYSEYRTTVADLFMRFITRRNRRINALKTAASYIKPYEKIFGNHTLSNKHCSLSLNAKNRTITLMSAVYNVHGRKMAATTQDFSVDIDEFFDTIAEVFSYNTTYDGLLSTLKTVATVKEVPYKIRKESAQAQNKNRPQPAQNAQNAEKTVTIDLKNRDFLDLNDELLDINSCSEAELTALPGINIVMAKKIINYRETKHPFKSTDEFFKIMKIKPHFAKQLEKIICTKKINMKKVKKAQQERIIDI